MTKTSQPVPIRVNPDYFYTPPWAWENSVEHLNDMPRLNKKYKKNHCLDYDPLYYNNNNTCLTEIVQMFE